MIGDFREPVWKLVATETRSECGDSVTEYTRSQDRPFFAQVTLKGETITQQGAQQQSVTMWEFQFRGLTGFDKTVRLEWKGQEYEAIAVSEPNMKYPITQVTARRMNGSN